VYNVTMHDIIRAKCHIAAEKKDFFLSV